VLNPPRAFLSFFLASLSVGMGFADSPLPRRDISGLYDTQRQLQFSVSDYRDPAGKAWIRLSCECDGAYRQKMSDVLATLWDFNSWPKVFARIVDVKLRSNDGTTAVIEQKTGLRLFNLSYASDIVFREVLTRSAKSAVLSFEGIQSDDKTLSAKGSWTLEDRTDASGIATYVRYYFETCIAQQYPAQTEIMRQFGGADIRALIQQLGEATARRAKKS
jgi:hypothetical protein